MTHNEMGVIVRLSLHYLLPLTSPLRIVNSEALCDCFCGQWQFGALKSPQDV